MVQAADSVPSDIPIEEPSRATLRDDPQYFPPDPGAEDSLSSQLELGVDVLRWADFEAVDPPSPQLTPHVATSPGKVDSSSSSSPSLSPQVADFNGQSSPPIIGIIIAGFLVFAFVFIVYRGLFGPSGPHECQVCNSEFKEKAKRYRWQFKEGDEAIVCSRCYRKLENTRSAEKFDELMLTRKRQTNQEYGRQPISSAVKREIWNRDAGKCVECGSKERLEYDHIIPVSKGGSNTVRNLQLLCEQCNRSKSAKIQ